MDIDLDILNHHIDRQKYLAAANTGEERREAQSLLYILEQVKEDILRWHYLLDWDVSDS